MCGVAGVLGHDPRARESVARMTAALHHRGPDDGGVWLDERAGVALGHRRLSIIDLSAEGHQPMVSSCGRFVLVFNGEIYNFRALRKELEAGGDRFRGHSDTEVLLAAMRRHGVRRALERANGMFALALWDTEARTLTLARDRLGEKPLYYGWMGRTLLFGSELRALRAHPAFAASVDRGAVALLVRHGYIGAPHSIFAGVRKLPPATTLTLSPERPGELPAPEPYWSAHDAAVRGLATPSSARPEEVVAELEELLADAVKLRMEADVPLGAFLSGGVDSSTVVALMQAQSSRPVRTFTIGFEEEAFSEAAHARAVADHLGTDHTEHTVTMAEAVAVVPRLPTLWDEPFADSSQIPTFLVAQLARRSVTVALSGDGGDELFFGYPRYQHALALAAVLARIPLAARRLLGGLGGRVPAAVVVGAEDGLAHVLARLGRRDLPGQVFDRLLAMATARTERALYHELVSINARPSAFVPGAGQLPTPLTAGTELSGGGLGAAVRYLDQVTYLPDDILVKVDRASMAVGLEARVPLLDHRVVELAWRLPLALLQRGGTTKWPLRQVLARHVPAALFERPKMGFGIPLGAWLRGPFRSWACDLLDERYVRAGGIFDAALVARCLREHLDGRRTWHYLLWSLLMFQAWQAA